MNVFLPLRKLQTLLICSIFMNISLLALAADPSLLIKDLGEGHCLVRVNTTQKYLLLPVEDTSPDVRISMIADNKEVKSFDVRLAINKVDYFVPVDLSDYSGKLVSFKFKMNSNDPVRVNLSPDNTACCREMKLSDTFDTTNREKFRPVYHFSPLYGWMNDPNGMVYKDGEYHLFYQHNPYGSKWGNMNWGHAISKDLINWEYRPDAITPDAFGTIFSGSAVVDHNNTAGFGAGAIIAIYTQNGDRQVQSIAYSTDNGRTFTKYADNPVLVSEARDFRDPKVFWYEGTKRWIMVLAVGQEMQFFSSPNLKNWTFESSFGKGQGAHGNVWECPDLFSVDGSDIMVICPMHLGEQKCSYLVGNMDYKNRVFIPSAKGEVDYGFDYYAPQSFEDPKGRRIQFAWANAWDWMPWWKGFGTTAQEKWCGAMNIPREIRIKNNIPRFIPIKELSSLRENHRYYDKFYIDKDAKTKINAGDGIHCEILATLSLTDTSAESVIFKLRCADDVQGKNNRFTKIIFNLCSKTLSVDRNYSDDWSTGIKSCKLRFLDKDKLLIHIFMDTVSVEVFTDDYATAFSTNIYPEEICKDIYVETDGGSASFLSFETWGIKQVSF